MEFNRMLGEVREPSEKEIITVIGNGELWKELRNYIDQRYNFSPEMIFYGKKYGWTLRYRRSGKTLISLFPEYGAFTALVVLSKKEGEKVTAIVDRLSAYTRDLIGSAKQLHDGKWLWIRVLEPTHIEDVKILLSAKRNPLSDSHQTR